MKTILLSALGALAFAQNASAVEVTGGTVELGYSSFTDDSSLSSTQITGGIEVGFSRTFAMQFDLGFYNFNEVGETGRNMTMHSVFHVSETASLGAFVGNDDFAGDNDTFYGVEGGFEFTGLDAEIYLAGGDYSGVSTEMIGLDLNHSFDNGVGLTGKIDHASFDGGIDLTRYSVGVDYDLSPTSVLYGELGSLNASAFGLSGSENFVGIGARVNFGASRGVTFQRRGLLDIIPGL